jgi:ABC-type polysaccharide/polyol phosphate transport system ATPase subunit
VAASARETEPVGAAPPAIRVHDVHKRFRKYTVRGDYGTLKSSFVSRFFRKRFPADNFIQVLDGIDLEVAAGTTLGLIGRNGSGKSTLLKVIAGILQPNAGRVEVRGKVSPLIELGAGFHPDFSGRENVHLNGLVLGMTKEETADRFDTIVEFAGLADSIDDPIRTYSSGMYMRLAFSVAVHADPDVLLIDEILAVGDEAFIGKCHERIAGFQSAGKTIVMVSHDLETIVRWCHEAVWLDRGRVAARGTPAAVVRRYHEAVESAVTDAVIVDEAAPPDSRRPSRLAADIRALAPPEREPEGWHVMYRMLLEITNVGDTIWRSLPPTRRGTVMVSGRIHAGGAAIGEAPRALIPRDVYPGERVTVELKFPLPGPGAFRIDVDLVDEEICWFSARGSSPASFEVRVS